MEAVGEAVYYASGWAVSTSGGDLLTSGEAVLTFAEALWTSDAGPSVFEEVISTASEFSVAFTAGASSRVTGGLYRRIRIANSVAKRASSSVQRLMTICSCLTGTCYTYRAVLLDAADL